MRFLASAGQAGENKITDIKASALNWKYNPAKDLKWLDLEIAIEHSNNQQATLSINP